MYLIKGISGFHKRVSELSQQFKGHVQSTGTKIVHVNFGIIFSRTDGSQHEEAVGN